MKKDSNYNSFYDIDNSFDFSKFGNLEIIFIKSNKLTSFNTDVLINLKKLSIDCENLSFLNVSNCPKLTHLDIFNYIGNGLELSSLSLEYLSLSKTNNLKINNLSFPRLRELKTFNSLPKDFNSEECNFSYLEELVLTNINNININPKNFPMLKKIDIQDVKEFNIKGDIFSSLEELNIVHLISINSNWLLNNYPNLKKIYIAGSSIKNFITKTNCFPKLEYIYLISNINLTLFEAEINSIPNLEILEIKHCDLKKFNANSSFKKLRILDLFKNVNLNLNMKDIINMPNLDTIYTDYNPLFKKNVSRRRRIYLLNEIFKSSPDGSSEVYCDKCRKQCKLEFKVNINIIDNRDINIGITSSVEADDENMGIYFSCC